MAKTVTIKGAFEILDSSGTVCAKKVLNDTTTIEEATQHFPQKIAPSQTDVAIGFGGVAQAKRVFIRTSQAITVKFNQNTDIGFSVGPGDMVFMSNTGVTALFVTTGVNETDLEVIVAGT